MPSPVVLVIAVSALLQPSPRLASTPRGAEGLRTRRGVVAAVLCVPAAALASTLETPEVRGLDKPNSVVKQFTKMDNGVAFADLKVGTGPELTPGAVAVCQWVLRRADGYFVDSSEKHDFAPVRIKVGAHELGVLDDALLGMRQGGVRRVLVPVPLAGTARQITEKLGLGFGPSRQLERQVNRPDPYNTFFYEIALDKVQLQK